MATTAHDIDQYLTEFFTDRLQTAHFDEDQFKLPPHELSALLAWIRTYDLNNQTPYDLYDRIIKADLTVAEQLICFEEIYVVTKQSESELDADMDADADAEVYLEDAEPNIYDEELNTDDSYDD